MTMCFLIAPHDVWGLWQDSVILLTLGCELEEQDTMLVAATAVARNFQTHCGMSLSLCVALFN